MKCSKCGQEFTGNFCPNCGSPAQEANEPLPVGAQQAQTAVPPQNIPSVQYQQPNTPPVPYQQPTIVINNVNTNTNTNTNVNRAEGYGPAASHKSKMVALILCIFAGYFGIHRFYAGKIGSGILYLFTGGLFCFGWIYDIIKIASGTFRDGNGRPIIK